MRSLVAFVVRLLWQTIVRLVVPIYLLILGAGLLLSAAEPLWESRFFVLQVAALCILLFTIMATLFLSVTILTAYGMWAQRQAARRSRIDD
jgi:uncharacterized membrane protein